MWNHQVQLALALKWGGASFQPVVFLKEPSGELRRLPSEKGSNRMSISLCQF